MKNLVFFNDKAPKEFSEVRTHFTGHISFQLFPACWMLIISVAIAFSAVLFRLLLLVVTPADIWYNLKKSLTFKIMTYFIAFIQEVLEGRLSHTFSNQHFSCPVVENQT